MISCAQVSCPSEQLTATNFSIPTAACAAAGTARREVPLRGPSEPKTEAGSACLPPD